MDIRFTMLWVCAIALLSGCSTYKEKFNSKKVVKIGYFADSTITMLSDLNLNLNRDDTLLVRRFIDETAPEEQLVIRLTGDLKKLLGDMVRYSIEIVNIAESDGSEINKIEAYADYIAQFRDNLAEQEVVAPQEFDSTIEDVRSQTEFIEALRKAQPLLNAAIMNAALRVDELVEAVETFSMKIDGRIDEEYADIIRYRQKLEREKFDILTAFEIIYDAYRTPDPSLGELRDSGVIWTPEIIPEGRPAREDLKNIAEHLGNRMEALQVVQQAMKPNWDDYMAAQQELDELVDKGIGNVLHTRIILLTWMRAHQKMSSGVTDPAKWFDIGEVTKSLVMDAPKALF